MALLRASQPYRKGGRLQRRRRVASGDRAALAGVIGVLCISLPSAADAQSASLEYAVKAAYLSKFAPFVEWPPRSFSGPASSFNICVVGADPFGGALDEAARTQQVQGHPVVVRRLPRAEHDMGCHLLFAGQSKGQTTADMLRAVSGEPTLTVTDRSRGISGGMIEFVLVDGKVRFDVDPAAAQASGLAISSKLLSLAVSRRRGAS